MPLYELVNPSDPYTFDAPNIEVAAAAVSLLSFNYGARPLDGGEGTPVLFGWAQWLEKKGIDREWVEEHRGEVADALDSFLIGSPELRKEIEDVLNELPADRRKEYIAKRQDRKRTSLNKIGETAYAMAALLRKVKP